MLRTLYKSDLPQLLAIENAVHITPWAEETFKSCTQNHCVGWVLEIEKKIAGFIIVAMSVEECHVLNLCVDHAYQRQGWGKKLLECALARAAEKNIRVVYLEVRQSNAPAIELYHKMDFQVVGKRKAYYPTVAGREDALILAKLLSNNPLDRPGT